ncbi:hypothetical protein WJX84_001298 [Apatococcus fuscideae]|uniref:PLAC8 family protein n=1 Tax=Apatococcus fuscideae TaxID=2026836 RepID=A0AAW1TDZ5_9CHLO
MVNHKGPLKQDLMDARANPAVYQQVWKTPLWKACCASPGCCVASFACLYCAAYKLHKRALYNDMSRYICCAGTCPCSGRLGESQCPELCMALEVFFCFPINVSTTRFMIQDQMRIQNTQCDNCLIGTMLICNYLACLCSIFACIASLAGMPGSEAVEEASQLINCIAQWLWCSVCTCMQVQHHVQLNERDRTMGPGANPMNAPVQQEMARPPAGGYPAPAPYQGAPGYPQGPPAGYPR